MATENMLPQEIGPIDVISSHNEQMAKMVKWHLTVNADQNKGRDSAEWLTAQVAGITTEILGANLPLEMGKTVYSSVADHVEVEVAPMSKFFEADKAGRITRARVLKQAFDESFKGWEVYAKVREEKNGRETDNIITVRLGLQEAQEITQWMVYTPNWNQNLAESTYPKISFEKWRAIENERRDKMNQELEAEGKPPYKKITKGSYTLRDWFDEENERRKIMGEDPLHEPQSGILQEGITMPDAVTVLKGTNEIVGFAEIKGYTFEELKALVTSIRQARETQIIQQQEDHAWAGKLERPITPGVAPQAKIDVGNGEFTAGINLLGEERMINNLRGLLYGGDVEKAGMVTSILPGEVETIENSAEDSKIKITGGKSTDLSERTFAVLRFLEAPEGKSQEYEELLHELGKNISEFGYKNVVIQTVMLNRE